MTEHADQHSHNVHVVGYGHYILIWAGLMGLTGATVALAGLELGRWIIFTALTIASIKGYLVLSVFMHLKFEDRTFRLFAGVSGLVLLIFIVLTFFDYAFR
jgi:cytochrome c oxidase subunit IV